VHEVLGNAVDEIRAITGEASGLWSQRFGEQVEQSVTATAHLVWPIVQEHEIHT
jgi:hypothetical protein